ncbi:stress protein, partial [Pseudoalteromonas sp. S409]
RVLTQKLCYFLQARSGRARACSAATQSPQPLVLPVLKNEPVHSVCQWSYPWFNNRALAFKQAERALWYKNLVLFALLPSL